MLRTVCVLSFVFLYSQHPTGEEQREPPLQLVVHFDGQQVPVNAGEEFEIRVDSRPVRMKLTLRPERQFKIADLDFAYPNHFSFEFDKNEHMVFWTMRGRIVTIMLYRYGPLAPPELLKSFLSAVAQRHGAPNTTITQPQIDLGVRQLAGRRVKINAGGSYTYKEAYAFYGGSSTYMIVVEDGLNNDPEPSAEFENAAGMLKRSLQVRNLDSPD